VSKNIVICSDGTGNTAITGRGTNVFKLFEAVDLNGHRRDHFLRPQVAFYDDGVGTHDLRPLRIIGGAAGWGLSANVRQLYAELARVYDPGDDIYMFGFSRGAFTVRTLAGFIGTCGLIDRRRARTASEFDALVKAAYRVYRKCYRTVLSRLLRGEPTRDAGKQFRSTHAIEERTQIRFLGVWDTVDAVGLPFHLSDVVNTVFYRFKFPDSLLSDSVVKACHALSIDDKRHSFHPVVWDEAEGGNRIEQVWFAGVHSNVGGGYPKQGLSLVTLDWMMAKAEEAGLRFNAHDRQTYRDHASVDDQLYDSRAGLGTFYRWKPRDIRAICERAHVTPTLHLSVLERIAHGVEHYGPENIPGQIRVVHTPCPRSLAGQRAANVEATCNRALNKQPLLQLLERTVFLGRVSYYVFLITCTTALLGIVGLNAETQTVGGVFESAGRLIRGLFTSPFATATLAGNTLLSAPVLGASVLSGLLLSSLLSRSTDRRIRQVTSGFWFKHQQDLRQALKAAREQVAEAESEPEPTRPVKAAQSRRAGAIDFVASPASGTLAKGTVTRPSLT
jgi:uncharacterized protein (DUF2235 family)